MVSPVSNTSSGNNIFDRSYEILEAVGRGRNSVVYRARKLTPHFKHDEIVALKVLLGTPKQRFSNLKRMRREALAMLACRHNNVVRLNDYVATSDLCYLSMEYCDGGDLRALLEQRAAALPMPQAIQMTLQVLRGLEAVHRAGVIHRDIKPENLLVYNQTAVKIADFGVAVLPLRELSSSDSGLGVGTFDYLSPETLRDGVADERSDLYSVGVTLFQLLTNRLPFEGRSISEQIDQKMRGLTSPLGEQLTEEAPHLGDLLTKALANDPNERFQTAIDFRKGIEQFLEGSWRPSLHVLREDDRFELPTYDAPNLENGLEPTDLLFREERAPSLDEDSTGLLEEYREEAVSDLGDYTAPRRSWLKRALAPLTVSAIALALCFGPLRMQLTGISEHFRSDAKTAEIGKIQPEVSAAASSDAKRGMLGNAPTGALSALSEERTGVIEHLFADGSDVPLVTTPSTDSKFLVALGLIGWQPVEINAATLAQQGELLVSGAGIKLMLRVDDSAVGEGQVLGGSYKELISGREGYWRVW